MRHALRARWDRTARRRQEGGAVAIVMAVLFPLVFIGMAALAVDVSQWYLERNRLQLAADAAALAGVPYMPEDLTAATTRARAAAGRNGFTHGAGGIRVDVAAGDLIGQLRVTVSSTRHNTFGSALGAGRIGLQATAVAEYLSPAPMGSPCNTFGNEPPAGDRDGSARPIGSVKGSNVPENCAGSPQKWASVQGPRMAKENGDRYQTRNCAAGTHGCAGQRNEEYQEFGYVFVVKVAEGAVGKEIDLQLFDPMFINTGATCGNLPNRFDGRAGDALNPFVTVGDANSRYVNGAAGGTAFCTGDTYVNSTSGPTVTSFALRQPADSRNPTQAEVQRGTRGDGVQGDCIAQYGSFPTSGSTTFNTDTLRSSHSRYRADVARTFHNWVSFCRFTPRRAGDHYLQVRTNVAMASGGGLIAYGNPAVVGKAGTYDIGGGNNSFAIRARVSEGAERFVSVSGYERMPIFMNVAGEAAVFNLLRVLPGASGRNVTFEYFDINDANRSGQVRILLPPDATKRASGEAYTSTEEMFPNGCTSRYGTAGAQGATYASCTVPTSKAANDGQRQLITIPIPGDYTCRADDLDGCWYRVEVTFPDATSVTDVTTWNARVNGDPVRLVE